MSRSRVFTDNEYQAMYYHEEAIVDDIKPLLRARTHEKKAEVMYSILARAKAWIETYNLGAKDK